MSKHLLRAHAAPERRPCRIQATKAIEEVLAIFGVFELLYRHASARREALNLDPTELVTLRFNRRAHIISMCLALVSLALAFSLSEDWVAISGILYGLMGPLHTWNGFRMHRALAKLEPPKAAPIQSNA